MWRTSARRAALGILGLCLLGAAGWAYENYFSPVSAVNIADLSAREQISFVAMGDAGSGGWRQWRVADALEKIAAKDDGPDFIAFLGDNFYGSGIDSVHDLQWRYKFEHMYGGPALSRLPFYAILGNHDYGGNWQAQIAYTFAEQSSKRWQMPARYYRKDFGSVGARPLLRVVFLDTNTDEADLQEQLRFAAREMQAEPAPIWRVVAGHHPVRNEGKHGDTSALVEHLLPVLKNAHVDLYVSGHDHNLQFVERPGEPAYVISGGGGMNPYRIRAQRPSDFGKESNGFAKITVNAQALKVRFYNGDGRTLSRFEKERASGAADYGALPFKRISLGRKSRPMDAGEALRHAWSHAYSACLFAAQSLGA